MKQVIDMLLRGAPILSTCGIILAAVALGTMGRPYDAAIAVATATAGFLGDAAAYALKLFVFKPLYSHLGRDTIPMLGRGPRPHGAVRCGLWPLSRNTHETSYGMPSGHATHVLATFAFLLTMAPKNPGPWWRAALAVIGLLAIVVPVSRVALGCHTPGQTLWGAVLGVVVGRLCASLATARLASRETQAV